MTDKRFEQPERSENPAHSDPKNELHPAAADSSSENALPNMIPAGGVLSTHAPAPGELLTGVPSEPQAAAVPGAAVAATTSTSHPSHFGRYRVEKRLGRGGFGEVYRAWDEQLNRPVAIKVTFQQFLTSGGKTSYLAEAQTVASLDHPQIVPVFDVGQTASGDYYVVSKLVEGSDLAVRIAKQRPSRTESVNMVIAIAEALQHAHSKGLVRRLPQHRTHRGSAPVRRPADSLHHHGA
jgi:hypothetical protein